jgi:hypothetical protein
LSQHQGDVITSVGTTSAEPHLSPPTAPKSFTTGSNKVETEDTPKTLSNTQKSRGTMKRTFQDVFAEGSVRDDHWQMLERLETERHERALGEQKLKRQKLEQKMMEMQHQREREREQHKFRMLQMQLMMSQNAQGAPVVTQSQNQPSLEGFGLMAKMSGAILSSDSSYSI